MHYAPQESPAVVVQAKPGAKRGTVVGDGELDHGSDETISA
jgi:hypothetical protein